MAGNNTEAKIILQLFKMVFASIVSIPDNVDVKTTYETNNK
jgi:hypothetical protein